MGDLRDRAAQPGPGYFERIPLKSHRTCALHPSPSSQGHQPPSPWRKTAADTPRLSGSNMWPSWVESLIFWLLVLRHRRPQGHAGPAQMSAEGASNHGLSFGWHRSQRRHLPGAPGCQGHPVPFLSLESNGSQWVSSPRCRPGKGCL